MVRFGAEIGFSCGDSTIPDDIDWIIVQGEEASTEFDAKWRISKDAICFKMDGSMFYINFLHTALCVSFVIYIWVGWTSFLSLISVAAEFIK